MRDAYYDPAVTEIEESVNWLRSAQRTVESEILSALQAHRAPSLVDELREIERRVLWEMDAEARLLASMEQEETPAPLRA